MSKTALEIAEKSHLKIADGYVFYARDFNKFCEALCREQRELCLKQIRVVDKADYHIKRTEARDLVFKAPTPKWREK
jgi:hypothetical protein